jgi:hypothetical protein
LLGFGVFFKFAKYETVWINSPQLSKFWKQLFLYSDFEFIKWRFFVLVFDCFGFQNYGFGNPTLHCFLLRFLILILWDLEKNKKHYPIQTIENINVFSLDLEHARQFVANASEKWKTSGFCFDSRLAIVWQNNKHTNNQKTQLFPIVLYWLFCWKLCLWFHSIHRFFVVVFDYFFANMYQSYTLNTSSRREPVISNCFWSFFNAMKKNVLRQGYYLWFLIVFWWNDLFSIITTNGLINQQFL